MSIMQLENYATSRGLDLYSPEFLWSERLAPERFARNIASGMSVLDELLRGMPLERRKHLFPSKFDLGSMIPLADADCTYRALADHLDSSGIGGRGRSGGGAVVTEGDLGRLASDVSALIGFKYAEHKGVDASKATKVLGMFWRLKQARTTHLISMLKLPEDHSKASLELTNPYAWGNPSDRRQLFSDVRGYLSAEIPGERLAEIDETFGEVRDATHRFVEDLYTTIKREPQPDGSKPDQETVLDRFDVASDIWLSPGLVKPHRRLLSLDEQLYIHMLILDFAHFVAVDGHLHDVQTRRPALRDLESVWEGLQQVPTEFFIRQLEQLPIDPSVLMCLPLLSKAVGVLVTAADFMETVQLAANCLKHYQMTVSKLENEAVGREIFLATLLFAHCERHEPGDKFKPYVHGQGNTNGRLAAALRQPVSTLNEEFERICRYSIDWIRYALRGQEVIFERQAALSQGLAERVIDVCLVYDTEAVKTLIQNFDGYARYGTRPVITGAWERKQHRQGMLSP